MAANVTCELRPRPPTSRSACGHAGALIVFPCLVRRSGQRSALARPLFQTTRGGVLDFFNMFSGGSLERMSLIALGVMPYITASIVMQLATTMSPTLNALKKEGESGRKKINQYTRYGTVFLCAIQGYFMAVALESWAPCGIGSLDPACCPDHGRSALSRNHVLMWLLSNHDPASATASACHHAGIVAR